MDTAQRNGWKLIACVDEQWGIGRNGQLLVDISEDKALFKKHTIGQVVIGGRKTMEGLPGAKGLPGRKNIVLSTDETYHFEDAEVMHSVEKLQQHLVKYAEHEIYVIGGAEVYRLLLPYCDIAYITKVHSCYEADAYCPNLEQSLEWEKCECSALKYDVKQQISYEFMTYQRIR